MSVLVWDQPGSRIYESGLDRGVLYLRDKPAVPWNGLTSVTEKFDQSIDPVYFDGMKVSDLVAYGDFYATMKAITYPDEFYELQGFGKAREGMYLGDQVPQRFSLSYRNLIGSDLDTPTPAYKIHIIYNVTAIPQDQTYATLTGDPSLVDFAWDISAVPEEVPGFRPTAHIILDSRELDSELLAELERILYGDENTDASLPPLSEMIDFLTGWYAIEILDHGDGSWSAIVHHEEQLELSGDDTEFTITDADAYYTDDDTYVVTSSKEAAEFPLIDIHDVGDGTWTAHSPQDDLIVEVSPGEVVIDEANITVVNAESYQITDTEA